MPDIERTRSWLEWLTQMWEEIPEPNLMDRVRILCLLYAELDCMMPTIMERAQRR
jgi:hypothetical protein